MIEIIEALNAYSRVNFIFLLFNLLLATIFFPLFPKVKNIYTAVFFLIILIILTIKLQYISYVDVNMASNIYSILCFPFIFLAFPAYTYISKQKKIISFYISFLIIFYALDLPGLYLFSKIIIPNYALYILYIAGLVNIVSLTIMLSNNPKTKRKGVALFIITYIPSLLSLSKWMFPVIVFSPFIFYYIISQRNIGSKKASKFKIFLLVLVSIILIYIFKDKISQLSGYNSFNEYLLVRVTKSAVIEQSIVEQNTLFGIADGNRFNIYLATLKDYFNGNTLFGLDLNYRNIYNVPTHNFIVHYISLMGIWGLLYIIVLVKFLLTKINIKGTSGFHNYIKSLYLTFLFVTFSVGESYSSPILFTFIIFNLMLVRNFIIDYLPHKLT